MGSHEGHADLDDEVDGLRVGGGEGQGREVRASKRPPHASRWKRRRKGDVVLTAVLPTSTGLDERNVVILVVPLLLVLLLVRARAPIHIAVVIGARIAWRIQRERGIQKDGLVL